MILQISEIQNKDNTIEVVCSTSKPDFKGDRIYIQGLDFTRYMKNPVFLLEHNKKRLPIGKTIALDVQPDKLIAKVEFWVNPQPVETWSELDKECHSILEMYKSGFMKGISISTNDLEYYTNQFGGEDIIKAELIEISAVTIPMNEDCLKK